MIRETLMIARQVTKRIYRLKQFDELELKIAGALSLYGRQKHREGYAKGVAVGFAEGVIACKKSKPSR